jgi:hypothetical protein
MMRIFRCKYCPRSDVYPDAHSAFMDGWDMSGMGHICPDCIKAVGREP